MKKEINIEIGKRVKEKRNLHKYTREELAEMIDISPQFLADIECGKKGMSFTTLQKICNVLNISCDYLILGKEEYKDKANTALVNLIDSLDPKYHPAAEEIIRALIKSINIATIK